MKALVYDGPRKVSIEHTPRADLDSISETDVQDGITEKVSPILLSLWTQCLSKKEWKLPLKLIMSLLILGATAASAAEIQPETVFKEDSHQITGVAVSKTGRLFVSYPRWEGNPRDSVVEIKNGLRYEYPSSEWNGWTKGQPGSNRWVCVQAVFVDAEDNLWVVDPGAPEMKSVEPDSAKVVKIDLRNNQVARVYNLTSVVGTESYLNDIRVETKHSTAYLTESKNGGIVVLNTDSGQARLVLSKHYSVKSDPNHQFRVNGKPLIKEGKPMRVHSDGLALHPEGEWLYYKPLTDTKLHRIRTADLRNTALSDADLGNKVNDLGARFSTSDGMIFDQKGNLYLTDIENNAVVRMDRQTKKVEPIAKGDQLIWPDSLAWGPDGYLYLTCSQIQNMGWFNEGRSTRTTPYMVYKLKVGEPGFAQSAR